MNKEQAIIKLCYELDNRLYIPFRKYFEDTNFGFHKEKFKQLIEETINKIDNISKGGVKESE